MPTADQDPTAIEQAPTFALFSDFASCLYSGPDVGAALAAARRALDAGQGASLVLFHDHSGEMTDIGPDDTAQDVLARFCHGGPDQRPGPGRPRLGVVSREVSLLPRHWDWLNAQPGGASGALRRLVDEARRKNAPADRARQARDAVNRVMRHLAGSEPGYEEASRALFSGRFADFTSLVATWRPDVRDYLGRLADLARRLDLLAKEAEA